MKQLQRIDVQAPDKKSGPGKPPKMEWLPITSLVVDDTYQREITMRSEMNVRKIAAGFSWSKFSPLIVIQQGKQYAIIDGQHRATAALSLGYDRVPCAIVDARIEEAASIFAAINGDVTPMTALSLFKAARAAKVPWALSIDDACAAASVTPCIYPIPTSKQKPFMTLAIGTMRQIVERHGEKILCAGLLCLVKAQGASTPGFLTSSMIKNCCSLFLTRPSWLTSVKVVADQFAQVSPLVMGWGGIEAFLVKRLGDGRSTPEAVDELTKKIQDLRGRGFKQQMVAATLRLPYADVQRLWGD